MSYAIIIWISHHKKDLKRYIQLRYTELDSLNCPAFLLIMDIKSDSPNPKPP